MNRNGKWMKREATHLTEAWRCEIVAKLSKLNAPGEQVGVGARVWSRWRCHSESLGRAGERTTTKSNISRHLLNLKVLPTSKALKLRTTLSLTLTTNCCAPMFKRKLDMCMMNYNNHLRRFTETLTNCPLMSSIKKSCIRGKWLRMTCSNNKMWTQFLSKTLCTQPGCVLNWENTVCLNFEGHGDTWFYFSHKVLSRVSLNFFAFDYQRLIAGWVENNSKWLSIIFGGKRWVRWPKWKRKNH